MNFLIRDLQKIFNKHDIKDVYEMGNQKDEYNPEIEQLLVSLLKKENYKSLKKTLTKIFEDMFGEKPNKIKINELSKDVEKYIESLS